MRSIMKSKYSVPAYVASALLGAVALMAFYESPISPLPVPPLPEPPVGRFPPEMPNISPNVQVPFRTNQQQMNYHQRMMQSNVGQSGQQQVLFPGNAQQRNVQIPSGSAAQIAANLLGKQQVAQRKSGPDYEPSLTRSLFSNSVAPTGSASSPKNGQPVAGQRASNSFLNMIGLGSGAESQPASSNSLATNTLESKSQSASGSYSGSNLVNRVRSYFTRPVSSQPSPPSPNDPYQRMSFVQALIKETNFLPGFLGNNKKVSPVQSASSSSSSTANKAQASSSAAAASGSPSSQQSAMARMQVDGQLSAPTNPAVGKSKPASSGYGLARAADRIAHALLETFTSGVAQRSISQTGQVSALDGSSQKSSGDDSASSQSSLASATSLISDLMSSYGASLANNEQLQQIQPQSQDKILAAGNQNAQPESQASGRTADASALVTDDHQSHHSQSEPSHQQQQHGLHTAKVTENQKQQMVAPSNSAATSTGNESAGKVRKTRSIGLEYPIENNYELAQKLNHPSRATQINNVIDYVSDSYAQNRLLINFVMNQVGLSQAVPYMEQILGSTNTVHT